ncbi:MSMEG_1061 family FMN-dependent PPOX-type flavoprotein [Kineosporia sp. R_H_3]|uniref:MSMEG_1061 family FMN-dependent PPOX-type flavoprotein n=1 Tax=Kineosporia sp. R_H_3 TaxID=1961848 RepID=UPI000B4B31B6|nr:MSMEG_1061 family FMN-dependent PPOX-type flavoprotein [Kineosporia sp. R_H_3]
MATIDTLDGLEALYPPALDRTRAKKKERLDDGVRAAIAASPFVLLATADGQGRCDVSPRGGPPGFVKVLDDTRVAVPDLNGNNLLDSLRNVVLNPYAGLLFVVPGQSETLRLDGPAHLSTDDAVLDLFVEEVRRPVLAVVVEVGTVFSHCAKAFRRSRLWDPQTWPDADERVVLAARYRQLGLSMSFDEYVAANEEKIAADLEADRPV